LTSHPQVVEVEATGRIVSGDGMPQLAVLLVCDACGARIDRPVSDAARR